MAKKKKEDKEVREHGTALQERSFSIIDEYFSNGFNVAAAVQKVLPGTPDSTAYSLHNAMMKSKQAQDYIAEKRHQIRTRANIAPEQIALELVNWIYSDATAYVGITPQELKDLPADVKRCIQSVDHNITERVDKAGNRIKTEKMTVRLVDKNKAVASLAKILGMNELDNKQKQNKIDIGSLNINELKVLQQVLKPSSGSNQ